MTNANLYPDLQNLSGLYAALNAALAREGSDLTAEDLPEEMRIVSYARVENNNRASQVYIAAEERLFLIDFWRAGVQFANAETDNIDLTALLIDTWVGKACSLQQLKELPTVIVRDSADAFDTGAEVEYTWQQYLNADYENPDGLTELVRIAAAAPELRQLFPFTSMYRLCFSRCTGYPYTNDLPYLSPCADGTYEARGIENHLLGKGSAEEVIKIVVANLPPNCGPARPGTADELDPT